MNEVRGYLERDPDRLAALWERRPARVARGVAPDDRVIGDDLGDGLRRSFRGSGSPAILPEAKVVHDRADDLHELRHEAADGLEPANE
jgi:hypothetical protein